ncbi:MAG: L-ectoine synthase [Tepidisphaera sp.]|nr:L-ectoine synthase [Tepidisphaera sp.]
MLVRRLDDIRGTDDEVDDGQWVSTRFVLRRDGMGHSFHETFIRPGESLHMQYLNHFETVYCIDGEGEIEDLTEGGIWHISPGTLYALTDHQEHILRAFDDGLRLVCAFTPALVGPETHDERGSYPLLDDDGSVRRA